MRDIRIGDGRVLRVHDSGSGTAGGGSTAGGGAGGAGEAAPVTVLWHHGSPQTGAPLEPVLAATAARGIRLVTYARPGYGGSDPAPGRDVAAAAADVAAIADALGVHRFAVMGASGGGPHALACAAALPDRVRATVALASPAPFTSDFDWYAGMTSDGGLRAAARGRAARERYARTAEFDPACFTAADWAALDGPWATLGADAQLAGSAGPGGLIDDDVAFARPWGFDLADVRTPVLLVQGDQDRVIPPAHAQWLHDRLKASQLWLRPGDGHVSVLDAVPPALDWVLAHP
jgi:pimeloyl-ACP methyl ester carboxylesterase